MDCVGSGWLNGNEQLKRLNSAAVRQRIPLSGGIDLTHRCNLNCAHCCMGPHPLAPETAGKELAAAKILSIIGEISQAGCINFLITGGEPLVRPDFAEIYRKAKESGLLVTVFTNGTLISADIVELFADMPPHLVEISVYGATGPVHDRITGVEGSFERTMSGLRRLLERRVHVRLKTMLMTLNRHEFFAMKDMAGQLGVQFRYDAALFPRLNGDKSPLGLRVPVRDAVEMEFSDAERSRQWAAYYEKAGGLELTDRLYQCGAGLCSFHIDPYGNLQPCLMPTGLRFSLLEGSFAEGWQSVIPRVRELRAGAGYGCNTCDKIGLCGFCPPFFGMESGDCNVPSRYVCQMGELRLEKIKLIPVQGDGSGR